MPLAKLTTAEPREAFFLQRVAYAELEALIQQRQLFEKEHPPRRSVAPSIVPAIIFFPVFTSLFNVFIIEDYYTRVYISFSFQHHSLAPRLHSDCFIALIRSFMLFIVSFC